MTFGRILKEIRKTYLFLRLKEIEHRLTCEKSYKRMVQAMERYKKCDNKKPRSQIKKEMKLCKKFWGCYPLHYYRYDLYRRDKQLSERELINYIPEFFFYSLFLPFYDSKKYTILLKDKIVTEQIFRSLNIPQSYTICKLINNHIYNNELDEKKFNEIEQELAEKKYQKIFVKPTDGQGGYGIYIFTKSENGYYLTKENEAFNERFLKKIGASNDYIVQSGLIQNPDISKIYPHSINTLRITTENKHGNIRIILSTLRIGRQGKQVDNSAQDGIIVKIDVETGELASLATTEQCENFEKHPDTGFLFEGSSIPHWEKSKEFVIESTQKMPQFVYLGWDIALTVHGPLAIETNLEFGLDHYQVAIGGIRETFGIDDPHYYWKNKGKRA